MDRVRFATDQARYQELIEAIDAARDLPTLTRAAHDLVFWHDSQKSDPEIVIFRPLATGGEFDARAFAAHALRLHALAGANPAGLKNKEFAELTALPLDEVSITTYMLRSFGCFAFAKRSVNVVVSSTIAPGATASWTSIRERQFSGESV